MSRDGVSLSQMGLDRQLEELCRVYNERSDAELLSMHENRDDLTELAQDALAQVMRERRLSVSGVPVPKLMQSHATAEEVLKEDEVELQTFDDAFRLNEALRLLTEAEVPHRVLNWDEIDANASASRGRAMSLGLVVGRQDEARAQKLLQEKMKLFPQAEGDDFPAEDSFSVLDIFPREEALRVAQAFGSAGISYIWTDGRQYALLDETEVRIEVYASSLDEAAEIAKAST